MSFVQKFTARDLVFAVLTGLITGLIAWRIFEYLNIPKVHGIPWLALGLILPILWILGVLLGYLLGQWLEFFNQFGKFVAIGFTNFAVTAAALNILLSRTGYASGAGYSFISGVSFMAGVTSSYIWNKYWAFRSGHNQGGAKEFGKFFAVTLVAFGVNISVASFVVNYLHPLAGMNPHTWANMGAAAGSATALIFSFIGFKMAVFKR